MPFSSAVSANSGSASTYDIVSAHYDIIMEAPWGVRSALIIIIKGGLSSRDNKT